MISPSMENFLIFVSPQSRKRVLCFGESQDFEHISAEYREVCFCEKIDGTPMDRLTNEKFDLVYVPDNSLQAFNCIVRWQKMCQLTNKLLSDGGRLVMTQKNSPLSILTIFLYRLLRRCKTGGNTYRTQFHVVYPSVDTPHTFCLWDKNGLKWFYTHQYSQPQSLLKLFIYKLCVKIGVFAFFAPGFIVEFENIQKY